MFNRKQVCLLAGMELETFKHAAKNDILPILPDPNMFIDRPSDERGSTYSKYTAADVIAVACAVQLARGGGYLDSAMSLRAASKIISNARGLLEEAVRRSRVASEVVYVGYATMNSTSSTAGMNLYGTWSEIGVKLDGPSADNEVTNVYLVIPAHVDRMIAVRAAENQIEWPAI